MHFDSLWKYLYFRLIIVLYFFVFCSLLEHWEELFILSVTPAPSYISSSWAENKAIWMYTRRVEMWKICEIVCEMFLTVCMVADWTESRMQCYFGSSLHDPTFLPKNIWLLLFIIWLAWAISLAALPTRPQICSLNELLHLHDSSDE